MDAGLRDGNRPLILLSAGEASGDAYGARLATALVERTGAKLVGLAGPRMRAAGVEPAARMEEVSVLGISEVLRHLPRIWRAERKLDEVLRSRPDLVICIDYPGFHLRLASRARRHGVPVLYYVAPQVWAWGKGRLNEMRRTVRHVAVVFPFEVKWYEEAGIPVSFVGHPLAEELVAATRDPRAGAALRESAGLRPNQPYLALLAGSRREEVERLLPVQLRAAAILRGEQPDLGVVVPAASESLAERSRALARRAGVSCAVVTGSTYAAIENARAAVVTSGTATLETAALETPLVVVYRLSPLTWQVAKRLVRVRRVALANIVAEEDVAVELLQDAVTPEAIAEALRPLLAEGPERTAVLKRLRGFRSRLGEPGAADRVAELAARLIERPAGTAIARSA